MSRSRKKVAGYSKKDTLTKKKFNRSLRRKANQAYLIEEDGHWIDCGDYEDYLYGDQYMSYEIGSGREFRKHNCSWDIRDHHGLWKGGYQEYKARLAHWECLYPDWPSWYEDTWWKEQMK